MGGRAPGLDFNLKNESNRMKYIIVWNIAPENFKAAVARFKKNLPLPKGLKLVGRWHAMGTGQGFNLVEAEDQVALSKYVMNWADLIEMEVVPVVEDADILKAL